MHLHFIICNSVQILVYHLILSSRVTMSFKWAFSHLELLNKHAQDLHIRSLLFRYANLMLTAIQS